MYATNYAIQQLVSEGRLDLGRTLQSLPGWENYTDAATAYTGHWTVGGAGGITAAHTGKATITVADLLQHCAGEIPDPQYQNLVVAGGLYYQGVGIRDRAGIDRAGIIDAICRTPLMLPPHTRSLYSDVDFMILGLIVEQVSGRSLDEYMQDRFYGPLGLRHTTFTPLQHGFTAEQIAATELNGNTRDGTVGFGSFPDGRPVPIREYTLQGEAHDEKAFYTLGGVAGHAGLFSTVGDMAVLTQLMLNGGLYNGTGYFSRDVASAFTTPYSADPSQADASTIGLGWRLQSASTNGQHYFGEGPSNSAFGHQGWTGTLTIIDPAHDMTIVILTNMRHSPVLSPPNGFEASRYPISGMRAVSDRIYDALL
jgi:CubicO group peptidase (beta-lactamase class C family)